MRFRNFLFFALITMPILSGCTGLGLATSAGAVGGIAAAREGGLTQSAIDARIKLEVNDLWLKYDFDAFRKLSTTVEQGRVLVTGVVQDPDMRVEAIRLAWQPKGVIQVINEVRVEDSDGITGFARDTWISGSLRTKLIFDRDVQSINYTIDTVQGTVYLMGIAQDQAELNKVISHARATGYVRDVVSYVKLAGEPVPGANVAQPVNLNPAPPSTF
jgi:osmotically-inducible protein OsmY